MDGSIAPGIVPALLRDVYVRRRTGLLHFTRGGERYALWFEAGHLVYGSSGTQELRLGEVLLARGFLLPDDLERAASQVGLGGRRLGELLIEMGLLAREKVEEGLAIHAGLIVQRLLAWNEGRYQLEEVDPPPAEGSDPLRVATGQVVLEAARAVDDERAILRSLGRLDRVLLPASEPLLRFQRLSLSQLEGFVLSRIDGTLTAQEVIDLTSLPHDVVERCLFALLCTGLVEYAAGGPAPAARATAQFLRQEILERHARLATASHAEVLGLTASATEAEIKAAYLRLAKRYHPDVHHDPALADLRDVLEALFFRVSQAWQVLSNPITRAASEGRPAAEARATSPATAPLLNTPEELYAKAEQALADGRADEAIMHLNQTVELAHGRLRQMARLSLARQYQRNPERVRVAERELRLAIGEDPESVEAHLLLAGLYRTEGLGQRAVALLKRVLELRPGHREATLGLAEVLGTGASAAPRERKRT